MFKTERCLITTLKKSDYVDVKNLFQNEEVRRFLGGIRSDDSIKEVFADMLHSSDDYHYWVVREKQTGHFMGLVSLDPHHERVHVELSYQFLPEWWGKGYATEVGQLLINYAFKELKLSKVMAETQTANKSSCKLLERIGMEFERTITRFGEKQSVYSINNC